MWVTNSICQSKVLESQMIMIDSGILTMHSLIEIGSVSLGKGDGQVSIATAKALAVVTYKYNALFSRLRAITHSISATILNK